MLLKKFIFTLLSLNLFFLFSCKKQNQEIDTSNVIDLIITDSSESEISHTPSKSNITNKRIIVVLGYGYNEEHISEKIINKLDQNFGLDKNGGLIYPVIYPNDFRMNGRSYVSDLTSLITNFEKDLSALIILGAPERTHIALARIQDSWDMQTPFYMVTMFPQDDVLGIEATCDFVLESTQNDLLNADLTSTQNITEESILKYDNKTEEILIDTIEYLSILKEIDFSFQKDNSIYSHVSQMLKNNSVTPYVDPETGISSINHFIVQ